MRAQKFVKLERSNKNVLKKMSERFLLHIHEFIFRYSKLFLSI